MAELKPEPIGESDLIEYLDSQSDFAFELTVLKTLHEHGFACEHGGSYNDPVTRTPREFDIRASKSISHFRIRLAVECKNIRANFPLLILCLPRSNEEAFHEIIQPSKPVKPANQAKKSSGLKIDPSILSASLNQKRVEAFRYHGKSSIYKPNEIVGKSSVQVGKKKPKNGEFHDSDNDVYKKWAQAVSSAKDLIDLARYDGEIEDRPYSSVVIPLLVVPNERLWIAEFDRDGSRLNKPRLADRCSYYVNKTYLGSDWMQALFYQISHLEFVTLTGLINLIGELFSEEKIGLIFPRAE